MTRRVDLTGIVIFSTIVLCSLVAGKLATNPASLRVAMVAVALPVVVGLGFRAPRTLLIALFVWLTFLGTFRRIVDLGTTGGRADLLLLVSPVALGVLVLVAVQRGAFKELTPLAKGVLALSVLSLLSVLNPLQGSTAAGAAGLLFVLVPMLGFWVGRGLCDDATVLRLLILIGTLAVGTAVYGLLQVFVGFPGWDANWIATSAYGSLHIGNSYRPFASFASAAEFGAYTAIGLVVWLVLWLRPRAIVAVPVILLFIAAILYESSRSVLVMLATALGLMFAARRRLPLIPAVATGVIVVIVLSLGVRVLAPSSSSSLVAHQVQGLSDPLNPQTSTATNHAGLLLSGIKSLASTPLGTGVGAVTSASRTFGGTQQRTEVDPSNVAVALGLPGFIAYLVVLVAGISLAYKTAVRRRDALALIVLGVIVLRTFQWLSGGDYSVAILPWLLLGWLDGGSRQEAARPLRPR